MDSDKEQINQQEEKKIVKKSLKDAKNQKASPFGSKTDMIKVQSTQEADVNNPSPPKRIVTGISKSGAHDNTREDNNKAYQKLFDNNLKWVENSVKTNPQFFNDLNINKPNSKYLVIACSDSYVNIYDILGACPGEVYLHRNVGNLALSVDFNIQSIIQHAVEILKIKHIIVIGHTDCEAINNAVSCKYHGLIDHWLSYIRDVAEKNYEELAIFVEKYPGFMHRKLTELNIKEQVLNLCKNPIIQKSWHLGSEITVHGCVFETESGLLTDLEIENQWKNVEDVYSLKFKD